MKSKNLDCPSIALNFDMHNIVHSFNQFNFTIMKTYLELNYTLGREDGQQNEMECLFKEILVPEGR